MVANSIQNLPAFVDSGQHSIVTAPADTGPSPRMRNLTLRGSGNKSVLPAPVVALSCRGFSTLIISFPFMSYFWIYRPPLGNCVSSPGSSSPRLGPGFGSAFHKCELSILSAAPDARHRLILGLAAGVVVFLVSHGHLRFASAAIAGWNAFALMILALDWLTILTTPLRKIRELAQQQDLSRLLVFLFVVSSACAALFAVGFLISVHKGETRGHLTVHL